MPVNVVFEDKPVLPLNIPVIINDEWTGDTVLSTGTPNSYIHVKVLSGEETCKEKDKNGLDVDIARVKLTFGENNVSIIWPMVVVSGEEGCLPGYGFRIITEVDKGIEYLID